MYGRGMPRPYVRYRVPAVRLLVQERNALVVRGLRNRLQPGMDVGELLVRENALLVRRHGAVGGAHEGRERLDRKRIGCKFGTGDPTLALETVTLPAAMLHKCRFAFLRRGSERRNRTENETGGEYRQCKMFRAHPHRPGPSAAASRH